MARLDFPSNPTEGQEYTANGTTWVFTNDKWIVSVPEPVVSINDLSDATANTSFNFLSLGFGAVSNPASSVTAVGIGSLSSLTSGTHNTALGTNAGTAAASGSYNTAIGASATFGDTSSGAVSLGYGAKSGGYSVSIGQQTGNLNGGQKVSIGTDAGRYNTGNYSIAIGAYAGRGSNTVGATGSNISIGNNSGYNLTTGSNNIILGGGAGGSITTGSSNILMGDSSGTWMTTAIGNVGVGPATLTGSISLGGTGQYNTSLGYGAGYKVISANNSIAIGHYAAGETVTSGENWIAIGANTAYGYNALTDTVVIGRDALKNTGPQTASKNSVVIGAGAVNNTVGSAVSNNVIAIGYNAQAIGNNEITLGNADITRFRIPGLSLDTNDATSGQLLGWDGTNFSWIDNTAITGGFATETYVDTAISNLANSAPAALDTLNELAAALGDDANFATTVTNSLATKANTADLATVATSGSYTDLTDTPSIPVTTTVTSNGTFVAIPDAKIETYYGSTIGVGNPDRQYIAINSQFAYSNTYPLGSEVYGAPVPGAPQLLISSVPNGNGSDPYANISGSIIIGGGNAIDARPGDQPGFRATIVGIEAMAKSTFPQYSTAIGYRALNQINQSAWNTVVGMYAASGLTNGANNTIVGHNAGRDLDEGWNNIIIGANAQSSSNTSNNEITLGNDNISRFRIPGIGLDLTSSTGAPVAIKPYKKAGDKVFIYSAMSMSSSTPTAATSDMIQQRIHLWPIVLKHTIPSTSGVTFAINITVADSDGLIQLGLYSPDGEAQGAIGVPRTLISKTTDISTDTTGAKSNIASTISGEDVTPGTYYLALLYKPGSLSGDTVSFGRTNFTKNELNPIQYPDLSDILGHNSSGVSRLGLTTWSGYAAQELPVDLFDMGGDGSVPHFGLYDITDVGYEFPNIHLILP